MRKFESKTLEPQIITPQILGLKLGEFLHWTQAAQCRLLKGHFQKISKCEFDGTVAGEKYTDAAINSYVGL